MAVLDTVLLRRVLAVAVVVVFSVLVDRLVPQPVPMVEAHKVVLVDRLPVMVVHHHLVAAVVVQVRLPNHRAKVVQQYMAVAVAVVVLMVLMLAGMAEILFMVAVAVAVVQTGQLVAQVEHRKRAVLVGMVEVMVVRLLPELFPLVVAVVLKTRIQVQAVTVKCA